MYNPRTPGLRPATLPPPSPQQICFPNVPPPDPFWQRPKLQAHLASLLENVAILQSIGDELEAIQSLDESGHGPLASMAPGDEIPSDEQSSKDGLSRGLDFTPSKKILLKTLQENANSWPESKSFATQAAQQLLGVVKSQLHPLKAVLDGSAGHEKALAAKKLGYKRKKLTRNRKWRSLKRRRVAEALRKERERYEVADRDADEWRAREIAKVIAKRKMERMKELAEKTSKDEKARQNEEMEMVLIIEKLQELRALRIIKLKKQGRFFPEEDDQFVERVRAAVEEEERQAAAAANTSAATAAILNAEEARKAASAVGRVSDQEGLQEQGGTESPSAANDPMEIDKQKLLGNNSDVDPKNGSAKLHEGDVKVSGKEKEHGLPRGYEGLPAVFHQYYFGSSFDMGTLIEVRQAWDAFIMPGGSRIPQHWVEAPPPADPVWASYLIKQRGKKRKRPTLQ